MDDKMIQTLISLLIYVAGIVVVVWKFIDYLSDRTKTLAEVKKKEFEEKSAGITAIAQLTKSILEVIGEIDSLNKEDKEMKDLISKLRFDYDSLINRFLDFLRK